jgi:flagellar protein FlaI
MVIESIKKLRGLFYRKIKEEEGEKELPWFKIDKPTRIVEFPSVDDISKVNVIYPLIEPFAYVNIKWDPERGEIIYNVIEPVLSDEEKKLLEKVSDALIELVEVELTAIKDTGKTMEYIKEKVSKIIKEFGVVLEQSQYIKIMYFIYRNFIGYNRLEPLIQDPNIEDISCDGVNTPVFIVHRKYGSMKTNIVFKNMENLRDFVVKLSQRCGRYVSYAEPILDGTLPDGSRVSATLAGDVATRGPTFSIRKFGENPFSPIDQISLNTANSEMLAYLWYLLELKGNMLIVGSTGTGKTSFLNSLCMFIAPDAKIVSIEDTKEIRIPHEHWISGLARVGFGIPLPSGEKYGEVSMFDLLKESFRQNPDYVIVGETRGIEAYVMFQGMASGHCSFSTFHAGSLDAVVKRLTSPPINLAPSLIESLNAVLIMTHAKDKGKSARRLKEIVEIVSVDPKTEEVKTNVVFMWDPIYDTYQKVNESVILRKLIEAKGETFEYVLAEIERRKKILEWMISKGIKDYKEVVKHIHMYYREPKKLFELMNEKYDVLEKVEVEKPLKMEVPQMIEQKQLVKEEIPIPVVQPAKRVSMLDLLGFKMIREKK